MKSKAVIIGVLIVLAIVFGWIAFSEEAEMKEYVSLERAFVRAPNTPYLPTTYVLGISVDEELYRIIRCESNFRPEVCSYAGCEALVNNFTSFGVVNNSLNTIY